MRSQKRKKISISPPEVISEDDSMMVISKPAGYIVNKAATTKDQPVIQDWIAQNFDFSLAGNDEFRSGIVHRLDKETSGVLIIAKNSAAFKNIQEQFKNRTVKKIYSALVHGRLEPDAGMISVPVGRLPWNRKRFGILTGGRPSETKYQVESYYEKDGRQYSLVNFYPRTGRTHQIRIHAKYISHSIVADEFYAGRKTARDDRKWCPRMFLHAMGIEFNHPRTGERVSYVAPLPPELSKVLILMQTK